MFEEKINHNMTQDLSVIQHFPHGNINQAEPLKWFTDAKAGSPKAMPPIGYGTCCRPGTRGEDAQLNIGVLSAWRMENLLSAEHLKPPGTTGMERWQAKGRRNVGFLLSFTMKPHHKFHTYRSP